MIHDHVDFTIQNFRIKSRTVKNYTMSSNHFHDAYELYYLNSGTRQYFINDSTYTVRPGSFVMVKPHIIHKTMDTGEEHSRILMSFKPSFLPFEGLAEILGETYDKAYVVNLPHGMQTIIEGYLAKIIDEANHQSIGYLASIQALLMSILLQLSRYISSQPDKIDDQSILNEKIYEIISYIKANYCESITLEDLSGKFYISRYYLSRVFKKTTGFTIIEYVHSVRILEAQHLLRETDKHIAEIAELVGFNNVSNFNKAFKSIANETPLNYRKLNKYIH